MIRTRSPACPGLSLLTNPSSIIPINFGMAPSRYATLAVLAALLMAGAPLGSAEQGADDGRYHSLVSLESARLAPLEAFTT